MRSCLRRQWDLLGDGPHERDQLTRDGRHRDVRMLAACDESTEALAQAHLRLPPQVLQRLRQAIDALLNMQRHLRGMTIRPRGFDQRAPRAAIALCFANTRSPVPPVDFVFPRTTGSGMLTALLVLFRSIGLICRGHRAVALEKSRAPSAVGRVEADD